MTDLVEMTEWVRFNADGSSDHITVMDGELFGVQHWAKTPYLQTRDEQGYPIWPPRPPDCEWLVEVKQSPSR